MARAANPASATGSRPSLPAPSITSLPRSRLPKATSRPACGASGAFFPLDLRNDACRPAARRALRVRRPKPLLEGDLPELTRRAPDVPAAVLIAITDRAEPGVILTVRREHMRTHAGQVAFPGGRIDPGEDAIAAALREAEEELGLDPACRRARRRDRPLSHRHRLCRDAGARRRPARPAARPARA